VNPKLTNVNLNDLLSAQDDLIAAFRVWEMLVEMVPDPLEGDSDFQDRADALLDLIERLLSKASYAHFWETRPKPAATENRRPAGKRGAEEDGPYNPLIGLL